MSNAFPDPSQSPWTNPDTGVEFIYDTTLGSWIPADEITSNTSETLDSVCQNNPVTDIDVTLGSLIYMGSDGNPPSENTEFSSETAESYAKGGDWYRIASGNGVLVAGAFNADGNTCLLYSTDGKEWLRSNMNYTGRCRATAFGNGLFAATLGDQSIYTSTNGIDWTQTTYPKSAQFYDMAYGDGTWVGVGWGNLIRVSDDNWASIVPNQPVSPFASSDTRNWSVAYGNGTFVIVSNISGGAFSTDKGLTWTKNNLDVKEWRRVEFGNGKFVAVGNGNAVAVSSDGISWTQPNIVDSSSDYNWNGLIYADGKFLATDSSKAGALLVSKDGGRTWKVTISLSKDQHFGIGYINGTFAVSGGWDTSENFSYLTKKWDFADLHELEAKVGEFGNITNDNELLLETVTANDARKYAYSPTLDLHVWVYNSSQSPRAWKGKLGSVEEYSVPLQNGKGLDVEHLFWAGDRFFGKYRNDAWESLDGENWTLIENITNTYVGGSGDTAYGRTVYHEASGRLLTAKDDYQTGTKLYSSIPGDYFNEDVIDIPSASGRFLGNAPDLVMTFGEYGSDAGIYSQDGGTTWNTISKDIGNGNELEDLLSYENGLYWAKVTCDSYAVSSDLVSWEVKSHQTFNYSDWMDAYKPSSTAVLDAVPQLYHNGVYVAIVDSDMGKCRSNWGYTHFILYSRDGRNWNGAAGLGSTFGIYQEYFDMDYDHMFVDGEDNLVLPMKYGQRVYYVPNFIKEVVNIDDGGLYYDGDKVATSENLQPLFQEINSHTDQIAQLDGEKLPYDILTLPTQAI